MDTIIFWISRLTSGFLSFLYFPTKVIGRENLPAKDAYILASNHVSNLDPFALGTALSLTPRFCFVAKEELFKNRLIGRLFWGMGAIPIKRGAADFKALREVLRRIKSGRSVIIFPEGTRGTGGRIKKPQAGIGFLAKKGKVPIIPAHIEGSEHVLASGKKWLKRHPVTIRIGQPIFIDPTHDYERISADILDAVYKLF